MIKPWDDTPISNLTNTFKHCHELTWEISNYVDVNDHDIPTMLVISMNELVGSMRRANEHLEKLLDEYKDSMNE